MPRKKVAHEAAAEPRDEHGIAADLFVAFTGAGKELNHAQTSGVRIAPPRKH